MALDAFKRLLADLEIKEREEALDDEGRTALQDIRELVRPKPTLPPDVRQSMNPPEFLN